MRRVLPVLLLLFLPAPAAAQAVKLPAEVKAEPGMVIVKAETDCAALQWWSPDGGLQVVPSDLLSNSKAAVCFALQAGRYRLVAFGAKGDKAAYAVTTVVVGDVPPSPPGPGPGPGPKPQPTDPLAKELQALYAADATAGKAGKVAFLAALYRGATQKRADGGPAPVDDPAIATPKQLLAVLAKASGGELTPADLKAVRARLSQEVEATLGQPDVTLDAVNRGRAKALFLRFAAALETLK